MNTKDIWHWLGPLSKAWNAEDRLLEQKAVLLWASTGLAHLARALYVDRGVLHLGVGSHVVAAELNLIKRQVLARVNALAPESGVTDLCFHVQGTPLAPRTIAVPPPTPVDVQRVHRGLPPRVPLRLRRTVARVQAWAEARDTAILRSGGWRCRECGLVVTANIGKCPHCRIDPLGPGH